MEHAFRIDETPKEVQAVKMQEVRRQQEEKAALEQKNAMVWRSMTAIIALSAILVGLALYSDPGQKGSDDGIRSKVKKSIAEGIRKFLDM